MKEYLISKKEFVIIIEQLKVAYEFQNKIYDLYNSYFLETPESLNLEDTVIKILNKVFDLKSDGYIGTDLDYFCYELEYGKKWEPGCITTEEGKDIDISTAEKLYDYITRED